MRHVWSATAPQNRDSGRLSCSQTRLEIRLSRRQDLIKKRSYEGISTESMRCLGGVGFELGFAHAEGFKRFLYTFDGYLCRDTELEGRNNLLQPAATRNNCWRAACCSLTQNAAR